MRKLRFKFTTLGTEETYSYDYVTTAEKVKLVVHKVAANASLEELERANQHGERIINGLPTKSAIFVSMRDNQTLEVWEAS